MISEKKSQDSEKKMQHEETRIDYTFVKSFHFMILHIIILGMLFFFAAGRKSDSLSRGYIPFEVIM